MKGLLLGALWLPLLVSTNPFEPDVVFDLKFDSLTIPTPELPNFRIKTSSSEEYECFLPKSTDADDGDDQAESGDDGLSGTTPAHPIQLLQPLSGTCLFRLEPYWTYEVCIGKHVRQFHEEKYTVGGKKKTKVTEFYLGRSTVAAQGEDEIVGPADVKHMTMDEEELAYFGRLYPKGDKCDLTGEPRQTEVRYVCDETTRHSVVAFAETSTCRYQITVATLLLCDNPNYVEEEPEVAGITCKALNGAPGKPTALTELEAERELFAKEEEERARAARAAQETQAEQLINRPPEKVKPNTAKRPERPASKKPVDKNLMKKIVRGATCFHGGGNGWWKFEFCPGQHVRQYHVHADGRREYIMLGTWDVAAHQVRFADEQANKPKRARSFTHHYHNGAHCDAVNQPRRVDVRYVCSSNMDEGQVTLTLEERATCEYVMTMRSTVVCEMLPLLDEYHVPVLP
eukprot:m.111152 g.111152  ORF g.111152 m.111152 type:complete len:457 (-) comp15376_c0_seq1:839-2209(-)